MNTLVLGSGSNFSFQVGTCLGTAGHRVDLLVGHTHNSFQVSRYCHRFTSFPPQLLLDESLGLIDRISNYCKTRRIDVVVPADFEFIQYLGRHGKSIEDATLFPVPATDTMLRMHNKWQFRSIARQVGVPHPETCLIERADQSQEQATGFPVVVKPLDMNSAHGAWIVRSPDDLRALLADPIADVRLPVLAQQFIAGDHHDLTILADNGRILAWTLQRCDLDNQTMHFTSHEYILALGRRLIAATQFHGVIDFDIRIERKTAIPFFIEANPRFPGTLIYKLWAGVNFPHLGVVAARGADAASMFTPAQGAICRHTISPKRMAELFIRRRFGRTPLPPERQGSWEQSLRDPWPYLIESVHGTLTNLFTKPPSVPPHSAAEYRRNEE